ncbi:MAG: hypothetical protein ACTSPB_20385, partial [Candidatus Thorarchaeota archaeon]
LKEVEGIGETMLEQLSSKITIADSDDSDSQLSQELGPRSLRLSIHNVKFLPNNGPSILIQKKLFIQNIRNDLRMYC